MGKILVEKFLRDFPELGNIYLLMRVKRGKSTHERLDELTTLPVIWSDILQMIPISYFFIIFMKCCLKLYNIFEICYHSPDVWTFAENKSRFSKKTYTYMWRCNETWLRNIRSGSSINHKGGMIDRFSQLNQKAYKLIIYF